MLKPATVEMRAKGRGYTLNPISTYVGALWYVQGKLALDQAKHDLEIYKAAEGRGPASHEEYVKKILKPARIKLPSLPEGWQYQYDPDSGELMVKVPE